MNIRLKGRLFKAKNRPFKTNLGFFYFDPQPIHVKNFFPKKTFFGSFPNLDGDDGDKVEWIKRAMILVYSNNHLVSAIIR